MVNSFAGFFNTTEAISSIDSFNFSQASKTASPEIAMLLEPNAPPPIGVAAVSPCNTLILLTLTHSVVAAIWAIAVSEPCP